MKFDIKWIIKITILAFVISIVFSIGSQAILEGINIFLGIFIIIFFILLGIFTDIIGVAVQSSDTTPFHAMASKKIKHAKHAKKMIKNADKVSSFFCDVIGDICNIITGSASLIVSTSIASSNNYNLGIVTLITTSIVAAMTIGGKALGKTIAINKGPNIVNVVSKIPLLSKK